MFFALRFIAVVILTAGSYSLVCGQDLGSSNLLFKGKKTKSKPPKAAATPKAAPKVTPKPKPATAKTKVVPKADSTKKASTKPTSKVQHPSAAAKSKSAETPSKSAQTQGKQTDVAKSKFTEFKDVQPKKIEITVGKPNLVINSVTTANNPPVEEDRFETLIESGNGARDNRNYSMAENEYKRAKSLRPRDSRSDYGLGNLYSDQQRWEDAEKSYRAALAIDGGNSFVLVALSYVLTQPIASPNLSDRYEEAETLARRAAQQTPSNALAFDQMGVALELRGMIGPETEAAYQKAIKLDSSFAPAYAHLGRLLRRRGLVKESANAYRNATERSNDAATMILVAEVMQSEQRYSESEELLRKALAADPRNASGLLLMGRALTALGKYDDAEKTLRQGLGANTNSFAANSLLGTIYTRTGKFEQAESALILALGVVPNLEKRMLSQQFETVGDGYVKTGKMPNAERAYKQAIALDPERDSLPVKLAKAQYSRP